jgi:hypothetical protein
MYNGDYEKDKDLTADELIALTGKPVFSDTGDMSCDNFALEYHLRIGFEPISSEGDVVAGSFKIKEAFIDIVYGKYTPETATTGVIITRKTSVSFYEDAKLSV